MQNQGPIRVMLAKVGLDGHDRGVKVVARALRDAGMDVIYTGLHRTAEEVAMAAVQEDVDVLGISLLSGAHMTIFPKVLRTLKEQDSKGIIVLGGAQSLHTNGMDEAFAIPTEEAMKIALRTQQVLANETRVPHVIDPLGGSYFLESLTSQYEKAIFEILDEVDARGGTVKLINDGWFQRQIADFAYELAIKKQEGDHPVVGVNCFVEDEEELDMELHPYDPTTADRQLARLSHVRATRDEAKVRGLLEQLKEVTRDDGKNIMPVTIELVRQGATMGDIVETLKTVWGTYRETPVF